MRERRSPERSGWWTAILVVVLGSLAVLLVLGGGAAAASFASAPRPEQVVGGSFSPARHADYSSRAEQRIAPQRPPAPDPPLRP